MTLIVSTEHEGHVLTISDVAITGATASRPVAGRPLDPTPSNPPMGTGVLVAMQQKAVRFDDQHLLLWSGNPVAARRVSTALHDAVTHSWPCELDEILNMVGLTPEERTTTHFIFHRVKDGRLKRQLHLCKEGVLDGQTVWFMGSGDRHFIDETYPAFPNPEDFPAASFLRPWLSRLGSVFLDEALDQTNFKYQYGGWFEVAWSADGKLKKVPYLIKFWRADRSGEVHGLPTFACWYHDDHLCIARVAMKLGDEAPTDFTVVRDPLSRTEPPSIEQFLDSFSPGEFQLHVIFDSEGNFAILPTAGGWSQFRFSVAESRVHWHCGSQLKGILLDRLNGGAQGRILRPEWR